MLSGSSIMSGFVWPERWWETASAALCRMPGMCTMWNLQCRGFFLGLQSLAFFKSP